MWSASTNKGLKIHYFAEFTSRREGPPRNASLGEPVMFNPRAQYALRVPREQLERFADKSQDENGETRVVSLLFSNVTRLFPGQLPGSEALA